MRVALVRTIILGIVALTLIGLGARKHWLRPEQPAQASPRAMGESLLAELGYMQAKDGNARPAARPVFTDVASELGLVFQHDNDLHGMYRLPELLGPGAGFIDYDNDDDLDVFVTGGGSIDGIGPAQRCRLFRNDGAVFSDVTEMALPVVNGPAYGVGCADYDHNGFTDIYVTRLGANVLLRNRGDGTFEDVTSQAGAGDEGFGASMTFFDYDRDGWLDMFVANYVDWSPARERECFTPAGVRDFCSPTVYNTPSVSMLYRNRGDGTFENVTERAGISAARGNGLGVVACDFDDDGWPDLYVANDQTPGVFWHNNGDGSFTNMAVINGTALDGRGVAIAGMGIACEDMTGDGRFDLLVTNIRDQTHLFLENQGSVFLDASSSRGIGAWSVPMTGFGVAAFDQDHDGELDCFIANGAVNVATKRAGDANPYAETNQFLRMADGRFADASHLLGTQTPSVSRAVASGDIDDDGDLDLLVTNCGGALQLLRNDSPRENAWLLIDARLGAEAGGRAAIGARVRIEVNGRVLVREVRPQQSYLASGDHRVHVGLGEMDLVDRIEVRWPNGTVTERRKITPNQVVRVTASEGQP